MRLGVNVDHIATVRQARRGTVPDPVDAALACERAGAHRIVCHLREDRRHIQDEDVWRLKRTMATRLNLEISTAEEIVKVAVSVKPHQVTLVPERRQELTTEGGLDVVSRQRALRSLIQTVQEEGIAVSLFIDPVADQIKAARDVGATMVELHTGPYANAQPAGSRARALGALRRAVALGSGLGLGVAAGHGLDYDNIRAIAETPQIEEVNIGFAVIVRALSTGLERAVKDMLVLLADPVPVAASHAGQPA
jgi:pyridoxine 5-phosphate synthase